MIGSRTPIHGTSADVISSASPTFARRDVAALLVLLGVMAAVYVPWREAPFEILDFPGYFKMLREAPSPVSGFRAIHENMALRNDGRFMPGYIGAIVLKWNLLGENYVAWQLWRFAEICTAVLLAFLLARRLGATRAGAAAAATVMAFAGSTLGVYLKLQVVDPPGSLLVFAAALVATRYQATARPDRTAVLMATFLGLALWMRETLVACVPFVVLLALSWSGKGFEAPSLTRRNLKLVAITGVIVGIAAVPILMAQRASLAADKYSANYTLTTVRLANISNVARAVLLPVTRVLWFPANLAFLAVLAVGWSLAISRGDRKSVIIRLAVLLALPFFGIAVFAPWPFFNGYYGFPLVMGSALLLATSITSIQHHAGRAVFVAALLAGLLVPLYASIEATRARRWMRAQSLVDAEVVRYLASGARRAVVVGAVPDTNPRREFNSVTLLWSAYLINGEWLRGAPDISCVEAARQLRAGLAHDVLVVYSKLCPSIAPAGATPAKAARYVFSYRSWKNLAPVVDSIRADIWRRDTVAVSVRGITSATDGPSAKPQTRVLIR